MKKLLQLCFVLISPILLAQSLQVNQKEAFIPKQKHFNASSFQIEDHVHVLTENTQKSSKVLYYTTIDGGKPMSVGTSNEKGCLTKSFTSQNTPAFVLCNGYTSHLDKKEFIAKNIELTKINEHYQLNFDLIADKDETISYQIVRIDQSDLTHTLEKGTPSELWEHYSVIIPSNTKSTYELQFYNQSQLRYSQSLFIDDLNHAYQLYPTICSNEINIDFLSEFQSGEYAIVNINGQLVSKGILDGPFTTIDVASLSPGNYLVKVASNGQKLKTNSFIKQ